MAILISLILVFGALSLLALIHICFVGRALRRYESSDDDHERNRVGPVLGLARAPRLRPGMSKEDLEKLPSYDYMSKRREMIISSGPVDCAVCLENFKAGEKCRLLPICRHSFHSDCIETWLLENPICPICRTSTAISKRLLDVVRQENSGYLSNATSFDSRETETSSSSHFSEASIELRDVRIDYMPPLGVDSAA
ncbi:hypothetical protein ACFE04_010114 [Oxalis oulophora]